MFRENNPSRQSIFVSADIEHYAVADQAGSRQNRSYISPIVPFGILRNLMPSQQRFPSILPARLLPKLSQPSFRNDTHESRLVFGMSGIVASIQDMVVRKARIVNSIRARRRRIAALQHSVRSRERNLSLEESIDVAPPSAIIAAYGPQTVQHDAPIQDSQCRPSFFSLSGE